MTRADLDAAYDRSGQWSDTGRERFGDHWNRSGKTRGRKRRQIVPVYSSDGED